MSEKFSFHPGERAVQARANEVGVADRNAVVVIDTVIAGARPFIAKQFMVVLASWDPSGALWSSVLFGKPGFLHTDDGQSILVDVPVKERDESDPLWGNIAANPELGMLFIELSTRRRYRVNGRVQQLHDGGMEVVIREAYPNCPKYIQRRQLRDMGPNNVPVQTASGSSVKGTVADIVRRADTIFVASRHAENGADGSHRGGSPGFINIVDEHTLRIPDFHGNSLFNTMGNFQLDPRAGLCIPDFENHQILQLTGEAVLYWDQSDPLNQTGGTRRFWEFKINRWLLRDTPQRVEWEFLDASPFNPAAPA